MKVNIGEIIQKVKYEVEEVKKSRTLDAIKYVDKKVLIPTCALLVIFFIGYYYYIFCIYSPSKPKILDRVYDTTSKESQQIINIQATSSFNSSMKPNMYSNIATNQQAADIYKIPKNYMDITTIPASEADNYIKVFDVIYDYFKEVNSNNYQNVLLYFNKNFVSKNKITTEVLSNYYKDTYFPANTFIISNVVKIENTYNVKIFVGNKEAAGVGFYITYKLTETNGKLDISIDDLENFIKSR